MHVREKIHYGVSTIHVWNINNLTKNAEQSGKKTKCRASLRLPMTVQCISETAAHYLNRFELN